MSIKQCEDRARHYFEKEIDKIWQNGMSYTTFVFFEEQLQKNREDIFDQCIQNRKLFRQKSHAEECRDQTLKFYRDGINRGLLQPSQKDRLEKDAIGFYKTCISNH